MRVLIVARTKMSGNYVCVGGLNLDTNQGIRLLDSGGGKLDATTKFDIGQIWDLEIQSIDVKPPHVEDVAVCNAKYIARETELRNFLMQRVRPWQGGLEQLFDGLLISENQSCYLPKYAPSPTVSTGFWLPDKPLRRADNPKYYVVNVDTASNEEEYGIRDKIIYIPFVGFRPTLSMVPAKTLVRVSLARWWKPDRANDDRCYLQLSDWYA